MSRTQPAFTTLALVALACAPAHAQRPDAAPVDPDATPQARALLREIDSISGHGTLSGQHNFPNAVSRYSDRIFELTGAYPAVFGQDFGFSAGEDKDSTLGRPSMIAEVIRQYHRGALIALTWHAVRPTEDEPVTFHDSVQGHLTDWEWQELLTPGTDLHTRWERQIDTVAGYLRELQDAGVPVLFRPYHEMNGIWFWWGGRPGPGGSQELYRQLFNRYVQVNGLHNLVWVWNVNAPSVNAGPVENYFPGPAFADIDTMDIYGPFEQSFYDSMTALAGPHKPIALAEVGAMPTLATLKAQPRWAYMMMWSGMAETSNTPEQLEAIFHAPEIINRGDVRLIVPSPPQPTSTSPVDPRASAAARDLLSKLSASARLFTGTTPSSQSTLAAMTLDGRSPDQIRREQKRMADAGEVALIRWTPPSPSGGGQHPLDDFEWTQLRKNGSPLNKIWMGQLNQLTTQLVALQDGTTALVLDPLPQPNGTTFWWSNHPGPDGTQTLLADLHTALAAAGIHSVLLAAEPAMTPPASGAHPAPLSTFFSGPLEYDLVLACPSASFRGNPYARYVLPALAGPKPVLTFSPSS